MSTMQAQPGTPAALEQALRAQNPGDNCSIETALKYQDWATKLGVGFDTMYVQQANGTSSEDSSFTLPQVQAMGINQQAPLYIFGSGRGVGFNVGLELLEIAGLDGENSYVKVYEIRNPGTSAAIAIAALTELPLIKGPMLASLNALKKTAGLF